MVPKRILLAEDDADDREMFTTFLTARTDVELASLVENGVEVIDLLSSIVKPGNLPDLIILDQNMPKQNGLQTLKILKDSGHYQNIPVFVYSTYADSSLEKQSIQAGAIAVFSKPYTMKGYHEMLDNMLEQM
jgi:CheY-like chemotaxis protein